jgi:hypothetical protein
MDNASKVKDANCCFKASVSDLEDTEIESGWSEESIARVAEPGVGVGAFGLVDILNETVHELQLTGRVLSRNLNADR